MRVGVERGVSDDTQKQGTQIRRRRAERNGVSQGVSERWVLGETPEKQNQAEAVSSRDSNRIAATPGHNHLLPATSLLEGSGPCKQACGWRRKNVLESCCSWSPACLPHRHQA